MGSSTPSADARSIPDRLYVHMDRPDGVHLVGEMRFDLSVLGGFSARFRYAKDWLQLADGFAIDPINLPLSLKSAWVETSNKYVRLGVLFDAGPDMWGRTVVRHQTGVADPAESALLLMGRGNGVGALLFSRTPALSRADLPPYGNLPTIEHDLLRVHQAAHNVFNAVPLPEDQAGLLAGTWSIGGARAKAVMRDNDGGIWIAKFCEPGGGVDRQRIEFANLNMARAIGIEGPEVRLVETELGTVLLVRRFDRTERLQRLHFASGISLVSAVPEDKRLDTANDLRNFSYANLAHIISSVSPFPEHDRMSLYARMALNVAVHNTDDHLKNFGFVEHVANGRHMLRLSPVFDVVTQASSVHYLSIGSAGRQGTMANVLSQPRLFMLTEKGARQIVDRVVGVVANREAYYVAAGMSGRDIDSVNALIEPIVPRAVQRVGVEADEVESPSPRAAEGRPIVRR